MFTEIDSGKKRSFERTLTRRMILVVLVVLGANAVQAQTVAVCSETPGDGERVACTEDTEVHRFHRPHAGGHRHRYGGEGCLRRLRQPPRQR